MITQKTLSYQPSNKSGIATVRAELEKQFGSNIQVELYATPLLGGQEHWLINGLCRSGNDLVATVTGDFGKGLITLAIQFD